MSSSCSGPGSTAASISASERQVESELDVRPGAAVVIGPKSAFVTIVATFKKFALLKRLKQSAWNSRRHLSVSATGLRQDRSHSCRPGAFTCSHAGRARRGRLVTLARSESCQGSGCTGWRWLRGVPHPNDGEIHR
jgi:hypothetical protein